MTNEDLDNLSDGIKKLRVNYEKYFMGLERMEPLKERDGLKKLLRRLQGEQVKNTGLKFRLQSLQATLITYEQHWNRIAKQIEEGTWKRDKMKAAAMLKEIDEPAAPAEALEESAPGADAAAHAAPAAAAKVAPAPSSAPRPAAAASPGSQEIPESIRKLHEVFEQTRKQLGDTGKPVPIQTLAATITKQVAQLKAQYNCKTVEFKVVVKDGKPILKAIPK